jgi:hypothetical protein
VGPGAPRSGSPSLARGGWSSPLFSGRPASGKLLVLGPTRLKRTTLGGPRRTHLERVGGSTRIASGIGDEIADIHSDVTGDCAK